MGRTIGPVFVSNQKHSPNQVRLVVEITRNGVQKQDKEKGTCNWALPSNDTSHDDEDVEELRFEEVNISTANSSGERDKIFADVDIKLKGQPAKLKVKINTGAQGNILPLRIYRKMFPENISSSSSDVPFPERVTQRKTKITAYNKTQIKQYGTCSFHCKYGNQETTAEVYITEGSGPAILGLKSSRSLKMIELNCSMDIGLKQKPSVGNKEELRQTFPDRFKGIGDFPR